MERAARIFRDVAIGIAAVSILGVAGVYLKDSHTQKQRRDDMLMAKIDCEGIFNIPWSDGYGADEIIRAIQKKCGITDEQIDQARKQGTLPY